MLSVIRKGQEHSLDDGSLCFFEADDGFGMTPLHRLDERGPLQHGTTDRGYRLDPRIGRLVLFLKATSYEELYEKRRQLLSIFSPVAGQLALRWVIGDVFYIGDMSLGHEADKVFTQRVAVTLKADDPTFYDPVAGSVSFQLGGGGGSWQIPMSVPFTVGASSIDSAKAVVYPGSWNSFPYIIRITGPIDDPVIRNTTTGEKLDFTGITIPSNEYYDIDLRYGYKTIVDQDGVNKIADLTEDSDLASFHIAADPEAPGGVNSIRVTGTAIDQLTQVQMNYFIRYVGI